MDNDRVCASHKRRQGDIANLVRCFVSLTRDKRYRWNWDRRVRDWRFTSCALNDTRACRQQHEFLSRFGVESTFVVGTTNRHGRAFSWTTDTRERFIGTYLTCNRSIKRCLAPREGVIVHEFVKSSLSQRQVANCSCQRERTTRSAILFLGICVSGASRKLYRLIGAIRATVPTKQRCKDFITI